MNDLSVLSNAVAVSSVDMKELSSVVGGGAFLPYITLCGSSSDLAKEGKIPMGNFALVRGKDNAADLGKTFVMVVLAVRPVALKFSEGDRFYDPKSAEFQDIRRQADGPGQTGCGYGPEFLVWLPEHGCFAQYGLFSKTGRNESPNLVGPLTKSGPFVCTQTSHLITGKGPNPYKWHGPRTGEYNLDVQLPDVEAVKHEVDKFINPPVVEKVDEQLDR